MAIGDQKSQTTPALAGLSLAALGVVFGDIGTSPLYTLKTVIDLAGGNPSPAVVLGVVSRFRNHNTRLRSRLISREVAIGMYSRKFSRSITTSPGSRPSPSFAITGQNTPTATSTSPKIIKSRLIGDVSAVLP
jgi:K+ potassium transporter